MFSVSILLSIAQYFSIQQGTYLCWLDENGVDEKFVNTSVHDQR